MRRRTSTPTCLQIKFTFLSIRLPAFRNIVTLTCAHFKRRSLTETREASPIHTGERGGGGLREEDEKTPLTILEDVTVPVYLFYVGDGCRLYCLTVERFDFTRRLISRLLQVTVEGAVVLSRLKNRKGGCSDGSICCIKYGGMYDW
ncbi:hypothetical protein Trydic_g12444 [Trypoxylus dichotomus]